MIDRTILEHIGQFANHLRYPVLQATEKLRGVDQRRELHLNTAQLPVQHACRFYNLNSWPFSTQVR